MQMISYQTVKQILTDMDLTENLKSTAVRENNTFAKILIGIKPAPQTIVEIGTYKGIATLLLATLGVKVYTFDVAYQETAEQIWHAVGIQDKIEYVVVDAFKPGYNQEIIEKIGIHNLVNKGIDHVKANQEINRYLQENKVSADFVFIDGLHQYRAAKNDFEITKKFGRVLFHDVVENYPGMIRFINEIGAKTIEEFGYWENESTLSK